MFTKLQNIYQLGCKELWSLWRDPIMLVLIIYTFTVLVYTSSTAVKETLNMAPIAIVDEDHSTLSERISSAFYPPNFTSKTTTLSTMDAGFLPSSEDCGTDAGEPKLSRHKNIRGREYFSKTNISNNLKTDSNENK
jgi:hypothetical protein